MKKIDKRVDKLVADNRVKLHIFEPSRRMIWSVVGVEHEHWVDPKMRFCSCSGFYFAQIRGKNTCYHLDSLMIAIEQSRYNITHFTDDEYADFVYALTTDLI